MRIRGSSFFLRWASLLFILLASVLTVVQLVQYSLLRASYPPDMTIAEVPVGGLDPQAAAQRLLQVYNLPVELQYGTEIIDLAPAVVGFELNIDSMLAAADLQRTGAPFWGGFWDYLWNRSSPTRQIPLVAGFSEERLRGYLQNEISTRYDQLPVPAQPVPGSTEFSAGIPGQVIDLDRAVALIGDALESPSRRSVLLTSVRTSPGRPSLQSLATQLKQLIDSSAYDGLMDIFLIDLQSNSKIHFAYRDGEDIGVNPDIAFTASSTIKIPVMISIFKQYNGVLPEDIASLMSSMIAKSDNAATDLLMQTLDTNTGPLIVTETMQALGLENTFIAGYFAPGSFLLRPYSTPSNRRLDISTDPDVYNQTTPAEMGTLLEDIYMCSQSGGGALVAALPGQIDQQACQQMINYLQEDRLGALIQAGVPEGTIVAHKHGYDNEIFHISDAAIIYTPGGNYVLTIYAYDPAGYSWNLASPVFASISRAVYNYFNLSSD